MLFGNQFFEFIKRIEDGLGEANPVGDTSPKLAHTRAGKWHIYHIPRRFDAETGPEITEACATRLHETGHLILDFTETTFLGSAGLAALLNINRLAQEKGGALRLSACSEDVSQVIRMVRFDKVLSIYKDVASATSD